MLDSLLWFFFTVPSALVMWGIVWSFLVCEWWYVLLIPFYASVVFSLTSKRAGLLVVGLAVSLQWSAFIALGLLLSGAIKLN
jgi:hypothetical protein